MIVPSPGQMGPGAGSIGLALMRHPSLYKGLGMGPALGGVSGVVWLADLQRARSQGFGNDVQSFRDAQAAKLTVQWTTYLALLIMPDNSDRGLSFQSSGGGGPGGLPNLHQPPPSIEETGEILSNPLIAGEVPSSPRPTTSKKAGKRRKSCPPGYRWNGRRCVRKG